MNQPKTSGVKRPVSTTLPLEIDRALAPSLVPDVYSLTIREAIDLYGRLHAILGKKP